MSKVALIAKLVAKEGQRDQLAEVLHQALEIAAADEGAIFYILHADANQPDVLWFYELYRDQDALAAHGASDAMRAVGKAAAPYSAARPELIPLAPIAGKGL
jgi:quinol monooxygenase YgiN